MNKLFNILPALLIISCSELPSSAPVAGKTRKVESSAKIPPVVTDTSVEDTILNTEDATATYFVVVADTGTNYALLNEEMFRNQSALSQEIDTMGRSYNKEKDLIALPEDHEDELYAADYYPRRFPSSTLSLEYLNFYKENAGDKTIALVTGIYERKESADSALSVLRKLSPAAYVIKSDIFIGCIH